MALYALGLVGTKVGMTRIFDENDGSAIPVTVIKIEPNRVTQVKTVEKDGYCSLQVTTGKRKSIRINKPQAGHYTKAKVEPGLGLWEFRLDETKAKDILEKFTLGSEISLDIFKEGQFVDVSGISKGKGFAGVIKRHHFSSQDASHGNSLSHRAPGSIGQRQTPGRVFKNKRMAGHMGNVKRTTQNLKIAKIDLEQQVILVRGAVPGASGEIVIVKPAVKKAEAARGN